MRQLDLGLLSTGGNADTLLMAIKRLPEKSYYPGLLDKLAAEAAGVRFVFAQEFFG